MISIITPIFNRADLTGEFINSLVPYLDDNELILVDNGSIDNSVNIIGAAKKLYPNKNIIFYSHNKNAGFGGANNIGAGLSHGDILLFVSNDVKILGDFITPINNYILAHTSVAVGPRLIAWNGGWNSFKEIAVIPYLEGFCFALRKEQFNMVGGFDEKFFLDMEDMDLCHRLHLSGVGLAQIDLPVMHNLGGSFGTLFDQGRNRTDITVESSNYFMKKWGYSK